MLSHDHESCRLSDVVHLLICRLIVVRALYIVDDGSCCCQSHDCHMIPRCGFLESTLIWATTLAAQVPFSSSSLRFFFLHFPSSFNYTTTVSSNYWGGGGIKNHVHTMCNCVNQCDYPNYHSSNNGFLKISPHPLYDNTLTLS